MAYRIINNRTGETMEHCETFAEAESIKRQYDELGNWQDELGSNEYYGTYRIETA